MPIGDHFSAPSSSSPCCSKNTSADLMVRLTRSSILWVSWAKIPKNHCDKTQILLDPRSSPLDLLRLSRNHGWFSTTVSYWKCWKVNLDFWKERQNFEIFFLPFPMFRIDFQTELIVVWNITEPLCLCVCSRLMRSIRIILWVLTSMLFWSKSSCCLHQRY